MPTTIPPLDIRPDGAVLQEFITSRARAKFIQGPVRSGKTTAVIDSLIVNATLMQPPFKGLRRRKTVVVRNTYRQLVDTVIPSVLERMPESIWGPITTSGRPRRKTQIGDLEWEWLFYAADKPEDVRDFKSLEASDIWLSEYRYILREIVAVTAERIGQFPGKAAGGCPFPQLIGETNAPMEDHWSSVMSGQEPMPEGLSEADRLQLVKPAEWEFFIQPPGLLEVRGADGQVSGYRQNPQAENVSNLNDPLYYENAVGVKTPEEVHTELLNRPGRAKAGKPVYTSFRRDVHVAKAPLTPVAGHPIMVGVDFGRTPAALFGQPVRGRWRVLHEFWAENMAAKAFAALLRGEIATHFPGFDLAMFGDPAGENLTEADDVSPFMMFQAAGLRIVPASSNDPVIRLNAMDQVFRRIDPDGAAFLISPTCRRFIAACDGGYMYRRMRTSTEQYSDLPDKGMHSHIADAGQYMVLGGGEGVALLTQVSPHHRPASPMMGHNGGPLMHRPGTSVANAWRGRGWSGLGRRRG